MTRYARFRVLLSASFVVLLSCAAHAQPTSEALLGTEMAAAVPVEAVIEAPAAPAPKPAPAAQEIRQKLSDILGYTYNTNPGLRAARQRLFAEHENLPQALSDWKPDITATGNMTAADYEGNSFGGTGTTSKQMTLGFEQPLYRGGRTMAAAEAAENRIALERSLLAAEEALVLDDAARVYMDVLQAQAILNLNDSNRRLIEKHRKSTQERFDVGELTRTDVSQAEARLARADAEFIAARGDLQTALAAYEQVIGRPAGALDYPGMPFKFPPTVDEAQEQAEKTNPEIAAAMRLHDASKSDVDRVFGELLPELGLFGNWDRQYDPQPGILKESTGKTIGISATVPLFRGGATASRVRQAKYAANENYLEILETRRRIRQETVRHWEDMQVARAQIEARQSQAEAARIAAEGVRQEADLGTRTILDTLDAEQELLDAKAALVTARRNEVVAGFALARTLGYLTPETLGLPGFSETYDRHLAEVRWKNTGINVDIAADSD